MKMRLLSKNVEVGDAISFIFEPSEPISWQPGQYFHYVLNHSEMDDRGNERWFTISSAPYEKNIMLTTRFSNEKGSSFKQALFGLNIGDEVEADGPKGSFTLRETGRHILIAGGIGVTPYRSMLAQMAFEGSRQTVDLLYANKDEYLVFGDELKAIAAKLPNVTIKEFIDKRIELPDLQSYLDGTEVTFYLSGPRAMVESYEQMLRNGGATEGQIATDYFPGY